MTTEKTTDFLPIQLAQNDSAADDPWGSMNAAPEAPADVSASGPADGAEPAAAGSDATVDPWGAENAGTGDTPTADVPAAPDAGGADWLGSPAAASSSPDGGGLHLSSLWDGSLPIQDWINHGLSWVVTHFRPFFQTVRGPIDGTLDGVQSLLLSVPTLGMILLMTLLALSLIHI